MAQRAARAVELIQFEHEVIGLRPVITLLRATANGARVGFEFGVAGTKGGLPRRPDSGNIIFFDIEDASVRSFQEYFDYLD